jgi:hypothetical protein
MLLDTGHPKGIQHLATRIIAVYTKGVSYTLGNPQMLLNRFHFTLNELEPSEQVREVGNKTDREMWYQL